MADQQEDVPGAAHHVPTMTEDYSRISDTAKAVTSRVLPPITAYLDSMAPRIAAMKQGEPFVIADYGAADGVNESLLFEEIAEQIHSMNPSVILEIFFIDLANQDRFDRFWQSARLAQADRVEAHYIQRSFYAPFPELTGKVHLGFSSTALHWLDTRGAAHDLFQHPGHIQANQLPEGERGRFVEKWKSDWRAFFRECSAGLVQGGALFLANLTSFGDDRWPASAGYNHLRDICLEFHREGRISAGELSAIFVPDYFATPAEMRSLFNETEFNRDFLLNTFEEMTIPCAYFSPAAPELGDPRARAALADQLARVVRAWSESSIKTGLSGDASRRVDEIYERLRTKFLETPDGLPYQYCLIELIRRPVGA